MIIRGRKAYGDFSKCIFLFGIGIIAAGNGDFSVLAAIGKGIAGIAFILFVLWLMVMHPFGLAALIVGLIIFAAICNQ